MANQADGIFHGEEHIFVRTLGENRQVREQRVQKLEAENIFKG